MKKTNTIVNLSYAAFVEAEGEHVNGHSKSVLCYKGYKVKVWPSVSDAAKELKVFPQNLSRALHNEVPINGVMCCFVSEINKHLPRILEVMGEEQTKAVKWDVLEAEREEEERKANALKEAEEKRQRELAKAEEKVIKLSEKYNAHLEKENEILNKLHEAEAELEALKNGKEVCA